MVVAVDDQVDPRKTGLEETGRERNSRSDVERALRPFRRWDPRRRPIESLPWDLVASILSQQSWWHPLRELERLLPTQEGVELLFLPRPRPVAAFRIGPWASGRDALGTIGPRLVCDELGPLILTAGHVFPGLPPGQQAEARVFEPGLWRLRETGAAHVRFAIEPGGDDAGYDYALVSAPTTTSLSVSKVESTVGPPHVPVERQCTIHRGKGPRRPGFVTDTVLDITRGRSVGDTTWARCWLVTGRGGFAAEEGDSGSAVVLDDGVLLGHLVAVTGWPFGHPEMGLVQDAWSVLQHAHQHLCPCLRYC